MTLSQWRNLPEPELIVAHYLMHYKNLTLKELPDLKPLADKINWLKGVSERGKQIRKVIKNVF